MRISHYVMGKAIALAETTSAIVEIELVDGRTVQLVVRPDGEIDLRGWGNIPASLGNSTCVGFHCQLDWKQATCCETCYGRLGRCGCVPD